MVGAIPAGPAMVAKRKLAVLESMVARNDDLPPVRDALALFNVVEMRIIKRLWKCLDAIQTFWKAGPMGVFGMRF